jgi:hypothetical protein
VHGQLERMMLQENEENQNYLYGEAMNHHLFS